MICKQLALDSHPRRSCKATYPQLYFYGYFFRIRTPLFVFKSKTRRV